MQRRVDTKLEVMERKLDRAIENKERITIRLALGIGDDFKDFVELINEMQKGIADCIQIFLQA